MDEIVIYIITLLLGVLAFYLFNLGMFVSLKKLGASSFDRAIANGWLIGWLFTFPLLFVWTWAVVFVVIVTDYSGSSEIGLFVAFTSMAIVLLMPGVSVAWRIFLLFPSLPWRPIAQAAIGWTVPYPILLVIVLWCWDLFIKNTYLSKMLYMQQTELFIAAAILLLFVARFMGLEIMILTSAGPVWAQGSSDRLYLTPGRVLQSIATSDSPAQSGREEMAGSIRIMIGDIVAYPFAKPAIGWAVAWGVFAWLSNVFFQFYTVRSAVVAVILTSVFAGGIAALLMQKPNMSWAHFAKDVEIWFVSGLWGWLIAIPFGYFFSYLYIQLYLLLDKYMNIPRQLRPTRQDAAFLIAVLFALTIGIRIARDKFLKRI